MKRIQEMHFPIGLILFCSLFVSIGAFHNVHAVPPNDMSANLFQINGKVLNVDGSMGKNGLNVVVMNTSNPRRIQKDKTGNIAGDGKYVVTFFDFEEPVAKTGDVFEVTVIDKDGNILTQKKQRLTEADIQAFGTSIDVKLKPIPTGKIGANLFSVHGTIYSAEGEPVEDGFSVTVKNISKPGLVQTTITGTWTEDGGYIVTFFNLASPVAEAGDMVEIIILDKAGNPFAQKKQNLTEANVKAFGVTINISAPWDVNYDGIVDISDLVIVGSHFGESITRQVTPNPDINGDGTVDISDLVLVGSHFKVSE